MGMHRALLLLALTASCSPKFTSGKTECSDTLDCPSGYSCYSAGTKHVCVNPSGACSSSQTCPSGFACWDDGTVSTHYCIDNGVTQCPTSSGYYCEASKTCWESAGACSTVVYCGSNTKNAGYVFCKTPGYVPDCNGDACLAPDAGVPAKDAGVGAEAGRDSAPADAAVKADVVVADAARDTAVSRDSLPLADGPIGCTSAASCAGGQQCLSNQCCTPPATGGACSALPACGCPSGQTCYPSETTHAMACFTATAGLVEGADCTRGYCPPGLGCFAGVCKRYCQGDSDCELVGNARHCSETTWSDSGAVVAGVLVCLRICDPAHPQNPVTPLLACPAGFGCSSSQTGASDCYRTAPLPSGSTCSTQADCSPGYYCAKSGSCNKYCLSDADCSTGTTCQFTWSPAEYAAAIAVGYCK